MSSAWLGPAASLVIACNLVFLRAEAPGAGRPASPAAARSDEKSSTDAMIRCLKADELCHFLVHGDIVDQDGKPLRDVQLTYYRSRDRQEVERAVDAKYGKLAVTKAEFERLQVVLDRPRRETVTANGRFKVDVENVSNVYFSILFVKEGYHPERVSFHIDTDDELEERAASGELLPPYRCESKLKVVLVKRGAPTELLSWSGLLPCRLLPDQSEAQSFGKGNQSGELKLVPAYGPTTDLPGGRLAAVPEAESTGDVIATEAVAGPSAQNEQLVPRRIKLKLVGIDGGFRRFSPDAASGKSMEQQMRFAPDRGYEAEAVLAPEDLAPPRNRLSRPAFFIKVGTRYGRLFVGRTEMGEGNRSVRVFVVVELQPDGSTNLDTAPDIFTE